MTPSVFQQREGWCTIIGAVILKRQFALASLFILRFCRCRQNPRLEYHQLALEVTGSLPPHSTASGSRSHQKARRAPLFVLEGIDQHPAPRLAVTRASG